MDPEDCIHTHLLNLPNEILLYIFSYLDSIVILHCLKKVCRRFDSIVTDEYVWRSRLSTDYPKTTILFKEPECTFNNEDKPWSQVVYNVEMNKKFFNDSKRTECNQMQTIHLTDIHISTVNELKLVCNNRLCISVSRDRTIAVWNVAQPENPLAKHIYQAHEGWVWCVDACDDQTFCTGAWDSTLKVWSFEDFSNVSIYKCEATVLSLSCQNSLVAAGLFNSKLVLYDTRVSPSDALNPVVNVECERKGVVQGVTLDYPLVYTAGVNGTVSCYDIRTKDVVCKAQPLCHKVMSYSYRDGTIVIGDTRNTLAILDKNLNILSQTTIQLEDPMQRKMICIKQNEYDMFVGTKGSLYSFLKSDPIVPIDTIQGSKYEMTAIEYDFNNVLLYSSDLHGVIVMHKRMNI